MRLGIECKNDKVLLGACSLFQFQGTTHQAEVGNLPGQSDWGFGYMHEALQALLEYTFISINLNHLDKDIDLRNLVSAITLERLGFKLEGVLCECWK